MAEEWNVGRGSRTCAHSGGEIPPGTAYFSALREKGDGFVRLDFLPQFWPEVDKDGLFSYWKTKPREGGSPSENRLAVDPERFLAFFDELADAAEPKKRLFRYVVALILARRRILRLDGTRRGPEGDSLVLYDRRQGKTVEVFAPESEPAELAAMQEQLMLLFECDPPDGDGLAKSL